MQIIAHELKKAGITLDPEELRVEGVRWEMEHSGRNGRIAQQFVKWYLGNSQGLRNLRTNKRLTKLFSEKFQKSIDKRHSIL